MFVECTLRKLLGTSVVWKECLPRQELALNLRFVNFWNDEARHAHASADFVVHRMFHVHEIVQDVDFGNHRAKIPSCVDRVIRDISAHIC